MLLRELRKTHVGIWAAFFFFLVMPSVTIGGIMVVDYLSEFQFLVFLIVAYAIGCTGAGYLAIEVTEAYRAVVKRRAENRVRTEADRLCKKCRNATS